MKFSKVNTTKEWEHIVRESPVELVEKMLNDSTRELDEYRESFRITGNKKDGHRMMRAKRKVEILTEVFVKMMEFYAAKN